jgi:ATP-dependent 26S proteasome regulatory subunit
MYSLLATSDGFIKNKDTNKKLIFTTNIPNKTEFDEALVREGRCYGVIDFRPLTYDESVAFLESINRDTSWLVKDTDYSLAQLYHPNKQID